MRRMGESDAFERTDRTAVATWPLAAAVALMAGVLLGTVSAAALNGPWWLGFAQLPSAWLLTAAVAGVVAGRRAGAAFWGTAALLVAVAVYYAILLGEGIRSSPESAARATIAWSAVAVACGPLMGYAGWALARRRAGVAPLVAIAALAGWLWFEALLLWRLDLHGIPALAPLAEAAAGGVLLLAVSRRPHHLGAAVAVASGVLLASGTVGLVLWRAVDCAAGKVCA